MVLFTQIVDSSLYGGIMPRVLRDDRRQLRLVQEVPTNESKATVFIAKLILQVGLLLTAAMPYVIYLSFQAWEDHNTSITWITWFVLVGPGLVVIAALNVFLSFLTSALSLRLWLDI